MGTGPFNYIHENITNEHIKKSLDEKKLLLLKNLYQNYSKRNGYLTEEYFKRILRLDNEEYSEKLFDIFKYSTGKMYFSEFSNVYVAFNNKKLKNILFSFLIFGNPESISKNKYIENVKKFIDIDKKFEILIQSDVLKDIKYNNDASTIFETGSNTTIKNDKNEIILKELFLFYLTRYKPKLDISFFHKIQQSSKLYKEIKYEKRNYACDCLIGPKKIANDNFLEQIEKPFLSDKFVVKNRLSFDNFKKMMEEYRVDNKLIKLIIKYFQITIMKNSIVFNDFKNLFSYLFSLDSISKKKLFFFKIILEIYKRKESIKDTQLKEIFNIQKEECKLESIIDKNKFENIEDSIIKNEIDAYIKYLENLTLLVYIRYNLKVEEQPLKKKIINFILNKRTVKEYLIDNFDKNERFYPINIEFWNNLINENQEVNQELKINNSLIAEEDEIYKIIEKEEEKYNKKLSEQNNEKDNKNQNNKKEDNKMNKNQNDIKTKTQEKEGEKSNEKNEIIKIQEVKKKPIKGKLKRNVKYGENYVIICGDIYEKINLYFEFDILVELEKTTIYLEEKLNNEKEEKVDKNDENKNKENAEEKKENEKINNDDKNKEKEKEDKNIEQKTNEENPNENEKKLENKNEEQIKEAEEKQKDVIQNDKMEKENEIDKNKLEEDKLEINIEKNYIRKKENKNKDIKEYIVDFYPIKFIQFEFSILIKKIEKKHQEIEYNMKSQSDKKKFDKEIQKEKKIRDNRYKEYLKQKDKIEKLVSQNSLDRKSADEKLNTLNEQYKDLKEEEIKITKTHFFNVLNIELDTILFEYKNYVRKIWNQMSTNEFKYNLTIYNNKLDKDNFDLIYYNKKEIFINDEKGILNEIDNDFILMIIDQKNNEGKTTLSILEENENTKGINKDKSGKNEQALLSKEELRKIKEEKDKKEKLKKQKERELKEQQAKLEREKKRANQKITHPPYGIPNFGNTCYFNSVNQIILNLPIMQQLFSFKDLKYMINKENKFGYKGKLISAFMPLYELYPSQIDDNVRNLKSIVGKFNETFNNKLQQDANEYLNFILEGLHEELNIKSSKVYIVDSDDNYKFNTEDELGDLAWANNKRRNSSFIDSIFLFQLKSNLTCRKCNTKKVNFETSYVFNLPLSLCKLVTVHINLFRLPFKYKVYYAKINEAFKNFADNEDNKNRNIQDILVDYYSMKLTFEQKMEHAVYLSFEFDYEREKSIGDIVKLLRNIPLLELEPPETDISIDKEEIKEYEIRHDTELITYFTNSNKIINNDVIIDKFVDINDKIQLNIYEVLNTNGFYKVNKDYFQNEKYNLFSYKFNKKSISNISEFKKQIENTSYFNNEIKEKELPKNEKLIQEPPQNDISLNVNIEKENKNEIVEKVNNILSINDKLIYIDIPKKPSENSKSETNPSKKDKKNKNKKKKNKTKDIEEKVDTNEFKIESTSGFEVITKVNSDNKEENIIKEKEETDNIKKDEDDTKIVNNNNNKNTSMIYEYIIPIVHFKRNLAEGSSTIFQDFDYQQMKEFPLQLLILNNSTSFKLSSISLYNYIWDYNSLYMNHPNKNINEFWFNIKPDSDKPYKKCYPFVIRIVKENTKYSLSYKCSKCPWYKFCIGCILYPNEIDVKLKSDDVIFVDWCNSFVKEEIDSQNFYYKNISNEEITLSIESAVKNDKDNKYQSISDCFDLFFEKEALEDPLSCRKCGGPQNFYKNYEINKLPHVLILALKRFKYNENMNFKLKQLITYPMNDFKLKDKTYNLFGIIYHYGGINSGHYVCAVRKENKWTLCDDNRVYEIDQKRVLSSNAYILFYISNESIDNSSYFNCMKSLLHNMSVDKLKSIQNVKDGNLFKGEPVKVQSKGIGYVVEDYIEDDNYKKDNKENDKNKDNKEKIEEKKEEEKEEKPEDNNKQDENEIIIEEKKEEINIKKDGKVKVKFELINKVESVDKNEIEKLILVDEQKKDVKK